MVTNWFQTQDFKIPLPINGTVFVYDWKHWKYSLCVIGGLDKNRTLRYPLRSPLEWKEFWSGVLDVLLSERSKFDFPEVTPRNFVMWKLVESRRVEIALLRIYFTDVSDFSDRDPDWYEGPPTTWSRLLGPDDF